METSTSSYEQAAYMFPNDSNKMALRDFVVFFENVARPSVTFQYYFSFPGMALTLFHFFILTRKVMMTSSVMTIMIGVAVCDFVTMITTIQSSSRWFDDQGTDCSPPLSLLSMKVFWVFVSLRDLVRRSSTWLGVLMALIRLLVIRFSTSRRVQKLSEPAFGLYSVFGCFSISSLFSVGSYLRFEFVEEGTWRPMKHCTDVPMDTVLPVTVQKPSALFFANDRLVARYYLFVNGLFSKILPCFLLPILTFLLILELRIAEKTRKSSNFTKRSSSERTTALVTFITVVSFIAELPVGVVLVFQSLYADIGYVFLATYVNLVCHAIFIVNATIHCLICFLMSSQYRSTVAGILGVKRNTVTSRNS